MFPIVPNSMKYYPGSSPAYTGSSPYAVTEQPPSTSASLHRPSNSSRTPRSYSHSSSTSSFRKPSLFNLRNNNTNNSSSTSSLSPVQTNNDLPPPYLQNYHSHSEDRENLERYRTRVSNASSTSSFSDSIKSFFGVSSSERKAAKKAQKQREKKVKKAERDAYRRAQDMEATALYMAWRYGDGPNTESYCIY